MESTVLVKAFAILEAAAGARHGIGLGELATQAGLNKPTAHRILKTLSALGYVEKSGFGQYRQTARIRRLLTCDDDDRLLEVATPHLQRLHKNKRETINLGVLRSGRIAYLLVLESTQPLRRVATPNSLDPFHCTALGRAIVAYLPKVQREQLLNTGPFEARTNRTVVDAKQLSGVIDRVATQGFAVEKDQTDLGVTCIGVPVLQDGKVVAAVSASIPTARSNAAVEAALISSVRSTVEKIEKQLRKKSAAK